MSGAIQTAKVTQVFPRVLRAVSATSGRAGRTEFSMSTMSQGNSTDSRCSHRAPRSLLHPLPLRHPTCPQEGELQRPSNVQQVPWGIAVREGVEVVVGNSVVTRYNHHSQWRKEIIRYLWVKSQTVLMSQGCSNRYQREHFCGRS